MFEKISNEDLKRSFDALKSYVDRRVIAFVVLFVIFVAAGVLYTSRLKSEQISIAETNATIETLQYGDGTSLEGDTVPGLTSTVGETDVSNETLTVNVPVEIGYNAYDEMWEYLEYGNTVEYFHPEGSKVSFYFDYSDAYYYSQLDLEPPQFRALMAKFPEYLTYYEEGYRVNATIQGAEVLSINWVEDSGGQRVWDSSMEKTPRELNDLEKWSLMYAEVKGYEFLVEDWFDTLPECYDRYDWGGSECRYTDWSPAEESARAEAFYNFATNPANNVWVQVWGAVDARYRWVDAETGELLDVVDADADLWELPESGWLALQIGEIGDGTYEEPEMWETTYTVKVSPGFVVGIDQSGYIFGTGPLGWTMVENSEARRTEEWSLEKVHGLLPPEIITE